MTRKGNVKRSALVLALLMAAVLLRAGCSSTYSVSTTGRKSTIKVEKAEDGAGGESLEFSVGKDETAVVQSSLDKGQLKIDFVEVTIFKHDKEPDEVIYGDVSQTITVGKGDKVDVSLNSGDYVMRFKSVGETNGTVVVELQKK